MRQRGKTPAAALAVAAPASSERLPAPVHLTDAERQIWIDTVNDQPATAFTVTHVPVLEMYCRHVIRSRILATEIEAFDPAWLADKEGLDRYEKLLKIAERESRAASALARSLRITRQSTIDPKTAGIAAAKVARARKPWELASEA